MDILTKFQNKLYIDRKFIDAINKATFPVYNPADNTLLANEKITGVSYHCTLNSIVVEPLKPSNHFKYG